MRREKTREKKLSEIREKYNIEIDSYIEYDENGRMIYRRGPDGDYETRWEYDENGNCIYQYDRDSDGFIYECHRKYDGEKLIERYESSYHESEI